MKNRDDLVWIEISKERLKHNIKTIKKLVGGKVLIAPCVKGNAYGHGLIGVSKLAQDYGADWFCVNCIDEARALRNSGIVKPILIMGYVEKTDLADAVNLDARIFIYDVDTVKNLSNAAKKFGKDALAHIKIDAGMNRLGILGNDFEQFISQIVKLKNLKIEGLATHFSASDDAKSTKQFQKQLKIFIDAREKTKKILERGLIFHCSNSGAVLSRPEANFDMVRPGKAIYGYYPNKDVKNICEQKGVKLLPVLSLKTKVIAMKDVEPGNFIGYGYSFKTKTKTKIAVLPIGYYDGIDKGLGNRGCVLIKGKRAKIIGTVCMNHTIVDITKLNNASAGDEAVIIGEQGNESIYADDIADAIGTITYEVLTRLREGIPRYYV